MQRAIDCYRTAAGELMWVFQGGFCGESFNGPEVEIAAMLAVVESLDPQARALWDNCSLREFDFAYDCGVRPFAVHHDLSAGTDLVVLPGGFSYGDYLRCGAIAGRAPETGLHLDENRRPSLLVDCSTLDRRLVAEEAFWPVL